MGKGTTDCRPSRYTARCWLRRPSRNIEAERAGNETVHEGRYGLRALADLAMHDGQPGDARGLRGVAAHIGPLLEHILHAEKAGLVRSVKGAGGG